MRSRGLVIHSRRPVVLVDGNPVRLTRSEHGVLRFLASNADRTFTRRQIIDAIQGDDYPATDRTVDIHIHGLRKKLQAYGSRIETMRGTGYRFRGEATLTIDTDQQRLGPPVE